MMSLMIILVFFVLFCLLADPKASLSLNLNSHCKKNKSKKKHTLAGYFLILQCHRFTCNLN